MSLAGSVWPNQLAIGARRGEAGAGEVKPKVEAEAGGSSEWWRWDRSRTPEPTVGNPGSDSEETEVYNGAPGARARQGQSRGGEPGVGGGEIRAHAR